MDDVINSFSGKYRFLSNFYECTVSYAQENYPSVEHAYQAAKTLDLEYRAMIRKALTPAKAKQLGRVVPIQKMTNSQTLLSDVQTALQTFKQEEYAG
jgi:predicted NAD-dependent protein-ADP-ribosyltransferase YbiA (DUF1768 family)